MLVASLSPGMTLDAGDTRPEPDVLSRRESPRLEVEAVLNGRLAHGHLRLALVDLGFGGFAVESPLAFSAGTQHGFRFTTNTGVTVLVKANAVYCRPSGPQDGLEQYVVGFKYAIASAHDQASIDILIDAANSPLTIL